MVEKIKKPESEWKQQLSAEQYRVCRRKGTERPFSGEYWDSKAPGTYVCVACGNPLFDAKTKYDSGTGWPSYWAPVADDAVETKKDLSLFMVRDEVVCAACDSHLGHVFDDGPEPTGKRYCNNGVALRFVVRGDSLPELRT